MNWVDLILIAIILLAIIIGWQKGFIRGALDLIAWTLSFALGYFLYADIASGMEGIIDIGAWLLPLSFLLTTLAARLVIGIITGGIAQAVPDEADKSGFNKFLGIIPGAIYGLISVVVISALLMLLPLKDNINSEIRNSYLAGEFSAQTQWANKKLEQVFKKAIEKNRSVHVIHPKSNEIVDLPFTYDKATVRPSLEMEMLEMVNQERIKKGLKPLKADPEMTKVARAHSRDMFVRGYFAHISPEGVNPFDRMKKANIHFLTAGENLALAETLKTAHTNLMNSPGHRANILNPSFGRLGIGILDGGDHGLMISQEFRN